MSAFFIGWAVGLAPVGYLAYWIGRRHQDAIARHYGQRSCLEREGRYRDLTGGYRKWRAM